MEELVRNIVEWGREHKINNVDKQALKCTEELGEIISEICHNRLDSDELKDGIGDTTVTLIILADILGFNYEECVQMAYDTIKNRTGKTLDGNFLKDQ